MTPEQREELGYLYDLGFEDLLGPAAGRGPDAPQRRAASPAAVAADASLAPGVTAAAAVGAESRLAQLEEVRAQALACVACSLCETRKSVVFGSGNADASLMFIGEGPGANEDEQGLPFVGRAGELLTRIIEAIELRREQVYIANVVKCRPPNNRDPKPEEVAACIGFLRAQIRLVQPRLLVALGRIAAQTLLSCGTPIGQLRQSWHEFEGVPLRVTYHPAALLRNQGLKRPTWEDMQIVRDRLRELVAADALGA